MKNNLRRQGGHYGVDLSVLIIPFVIIVGTLGWGVIELLKWVFSFVTISFG